ncbi:hypothetical protein DV737_g2606, partial [Chaetothyriales sp. CBS 132003]
MDLGLVVALHARLAPPASSGNRLAHTVILVAGVAALVAALVSLVSIWMQLKNYRKPLLQRYVVRILLMVPLYSAASWASVVSLEAAFYLDPLRDIYEAFTIYTFLQLLVNFLGGERSLIIMMHGRPPVSHPWPLNLWLPKIDLSDPHTFLAIKRGILQYAYLKPVLAVVTIIMKKTGTFKEGYISLDSGYFWTGLIYNVSITVSLYALAIFWVCMAHDLKPFRPMPKFLCIKLIIFASYWQGFLLSILQFLGAIPSDVPGYTADNLAAAIQDTLICIEMPIFAVGHWYAFDWHDYADIGVSSARMPISYAIRDAFGLRDLVEDTKMTFCGRDYDYREFDSGDNVMAHEESRSRVARMMQGMRYERGGQAKYWIPKQQANSRTPLLSHPRAPNLTPDVVPRSSHFYRAASPDISFDINLEDEHLYTNARALEFGDWNYPVITAHQAVRKHTRTAGPSRLAAISSDRHRLQFPPHHKRHHRQDKSPTQSSHGGHEDKFVLDMSAPTSPKIDRSQLVDLGINRGDTADQRQLARPHTPDRAFDRGHLLLTSCMQEPPKTFRTIGQGSFGTIYEQTGTPYIFKGEIHPSLGENLLWDELISH